MKKTGRILLVLLVLVVSTALLFPTFKWYVLTPTETKQLAAGSNIQIREYARNQASIDVQTLKGFVSTNPNDDISKEYKYLIKDAKTALSENHRTTPDKWTYYSLLASFPSEDALFETIESHYREDLLSVKENSNYILQLGLDLKGGMSVLLEADIEGFKEKNGYEPSAAELTALLNEDVMILSSRIDQFGVTEPDIRLQGGDQLLIELPGETDPERVNSFLRSRGSLTFQLVDSNLTARVNNDYALNPSSFFDESGDIVTPSYIPDNKVVAGYYVEDEYGLEELESLVVLRREVGLDGSHLKSANVSQDEQSHRPVVNFTLDSEGGDIFHTLTNANVGASLAVVMDGKVKSVARINSAIRDNVQLTGGFSEEEAQSLAVMLKTSSLPIDLKVISEQAVGASLGDDAVNISLRAILVGLALVLIFVLIYYGPAGVIADVVLLMNLYMMIALLSALNFTLTLSSIAGIVLTLGMAIDANVIIYERMKEERATLVLGYKIVKSGFSMAFWTIMDSNVTTIIAAVVLSIFGSSSVKGFANTLAIGIVCSLFTSLFVSHLLFDLFISEENMKKVRLSWRKGR